MLATPPREKNSARSVLQPTSGQSLLGKRPLLDQDQEQRQQDKQQSSPASSHKENKRSRLQAYPTPEPSSSAACPTSPSSAALDHTAPCYGKSTVKESETSLHLQDDQAVLIGRREPSASTLRKWNAQESFVLPALTKNASRVHAIISASEVRVIGQNGLKVNGDRVEPGTTYDLSALSSPSFQLDCYSGTVIDVFFPPVQKRAAEVLPPSLNVVSSSPVPKHKEFDYDTDDDDDEEEEQQQLVSPIEPKSQPQPDQEQEQAQEKASPREEIQEVRSEPPEPAEYSLDGLLEPASSELSDAEADQDQEQGQGAPVELSEELVGEVATTLVFHSRSTVPTSDVLSAVVSNTISREDVMNTLRHGPFGVIEDPKLKDASGKRLEPAWYYAPEGDHDQARVESLGPFVKRVRKSQMSAKRYFWAKPALKPKRYY